jgi:hypothetical protein
MTFRWNDYKYGSWLVVHFGRLDAKIDILGPDHFGVIAHTRRGTVVEEFRPGSGQTLETLKALAQRWLIPPAGKRLGKGERRIDSRTLCLADYLKLPAAPVSVSYMTKVRGWGMMLNDSLGDCTCACAGHQIEQWSAYAGRLVVPADSAILSAYEAIGGYVPGDPSTDNGCVVLDVLNYWRKTGIAGHKIAAYVSVNPENVEEVKLAVSLFGNIYLGVQLPLSVQEQPVWTVPAAGTGGSGQPGSWGGHAIPIVQYNERGFNVITWGAPLWASWNFLRVYCDEAYAVLSPDWIEKNGLAPSQFNLAQLQADLGQL